MRPAPVETRSLAEQRAEPQTPKVQTGYHQVRRGETLYAIAWRHGLDYKHLGIWNRIDPPYRIYPGRQLRLSPPPRPVVTVKVVKQPPPVQRKPAQAKPAQAKPAQAKPTQAKPTQAKPAQARPAQAKPTQARLAKRVVPSKPVKPVSGPLQKFNGALKWSWPTRGKVVKHFRKGDKTRQGIRIAGNYGQAVLAAESGKVVYSGSGLPGYGKLIILKHHKNYLSAYGFNKKILAQDGDHVTRGERIAEMGKSPDGTPLLHFEIRRSDSVVDPSRLLPRR